MVNLMMMKYYMDKAAISARQPKDNTPVSRSEIIKTVVVMLLTLMVIGAVAIAIVLSQPVNH